jgi:hypothetical protein
MELMLAITGKSIMRIVMAHIMTIGLINFRYLQQFPEIIAMPFPM